MAGEQKLKLCGLWSEDGGLAGGGFFVIKTPDAKWDMEIRVGGFDGPPIGRLWDKNTGDMRASGSFGGKGCLDVVMWKNSSDNERAPLFDLKLQSAWKRDGDQPAAPAGDDDGWGGGASDGLPY